MSLTLRCFFKRYRWRRAHRREIGEAKLLSADGGNLASVWVEQKADGADFAGGKNENFPAGETFLEFQTGTGRGGKFGISNDDDAGLNRIEQGFTKCFGLGGQAGDDNVGAEAIGFAVEQKVLAGATKVRQEEDFYPMQFGLADERAVVGLGGFVFLGRMQNAPGCSFVAAMQRGQVIWFALQLSEDAAIRDRTETERAGEDVVAAELSNEFFCATNVFEVAVGEQEAGELIDALSAEEGAGDEFDGVGVAAVHQPILRAAGGIEIFGLAAIQWKDGQFEIFTGDEPLCAIEKRDECKRGDGACTPFGLPQPAAHEADQQAVVEDEGECWWGGDEGVSAGDFRAPTTEFDHASHPEPGAMIEEFGEPRQPVTAEQAAEIAGEREAAHRDDDEVGEQRDGAEDMKIIRGERQRAEPSGQRGDKAGEHHAGNGAEQLFPLWDDLGGEHRVSGEPAVAEFFQWRHEQRDTEDDEEGELKAGLEELLRFPE